MEATGARAEPRRRGWWTTWVLPRAAVAVGLAVVMVPLLAVFAKLVVEHFTALVYEIHWLTTVPVLVVVFALVLNRLFNEHKLFAPRRRA